jgi:drug/metabolite transporter (DMT)-like permease
LATETARNETTPGGKTVVVGIALMVSGIFCLSAMDAAVRWLMLRDVSAVQLIAVRGWLIFLLMTLWMARRAGLGALTTRRPLHHAIRAGFGMLAPLAFFVALKTVPLAEATAVFFCSVFIMTLASMLLFGERVDRYRWMGVITGFLGVLIVTRPGAASFQIEILLVLVASGLYCVLILMGRWMSSTESTFSLVFSYNLGSTLSFTVLLPWFWAPLDASQWMVVLIASALALAGHFLLTHAFSTAPVSVVAPFEYTALVWATGLGFLLWGDVPAATTLVGIAIILASGLSLAWRERRQGRIESAGVPDRT